MTDKGIKYLWCVATVLWLGMADAAAQAATIVPYEPPDTCTDGPQFNTAAQGNVMSRVSLRVHSLTATLGETLFLTIVESTGFRAAVGGVLSLYVVIYGMLFMTGHVRASAYDFLIRCIKVGLIGVLLSSGAWTFFNTNVADFFRVATDDFIAQITNITIGGTAMGGEAGFPMQILDNALNKVISTNMGVHLLAMLFTPPYGFFYLVLLLIALWSFLSLLLTGIWVYLSAVVIRAFLIGLAPIFVVCLLFDRTKHLFIGWINQFFNACLQPIMLFSFLAFFVMMILGPGGNTGLIDQILNVPVCWTAANETLQGTPFSVHYWRFAISNPDWASGFEPYGGRWDWNGPIDAPTSPDVFPIQLLPLITFLVLAELGKRFSQMVLMIARELSSSSVDLSQMSNIFSGLLPGRSAGAGAGSGAQLRQSMATGGASGTFVDSMKNMLRR